MKRWKIVELRKILVMTFLLMSFFYLPVYGGEVQTLPEKPTLIPDMHSFERNANGDYEFTTPFIPQLSNSQDHRIGLMRRKGGSNDSATFFLLVPEQLDDELMKAGPGATILSPVLKEEDADRFHDSDPALGGQMATHFAICDPKEAMKKNPYLCNTDRDCYDLHVIAALQFDGTGLNGENQIQLWSTPVTIEVKNPKTDLAEIVSVTVDEASQVGGPMLGDTGGGIESFHTPMIVGDNRLLIFRIGANSEITWTDAGGTDHEGRWDTVYAYAPGADECDVTSWTNFKPLTHAPDDPDVNTTFGFAKYPYRSPSGRLVADYHPPGNVVDIATRYIWVDQEANNIFFASLGRQLIDKSDACVNQGDCHHLYDADCLPGITCDPYDPAAEGGSGHQGWMMMGLWTHGKMVLLDSLVNHSDFPIEREVEHQRMVSLFSDGDVRIGTGRDASTTPDPFGWILTTVQFGSTEHFFNMVPNMVPRTARDVAWLITSGARTEEISFDDYLSFRTLIFSPMNALKEMVGNGYYYDGNDPNQPEMRLQNAATSLKWAIPNYGKVVVPAVGGETKGRIENVALGGIKARGFHLDPSTRIEYSIPTQDPSLDPTNQEWMVSLFFDRRDLSWGQIRRIVTFPSGAQIDLFGLSKIKVCGAGSLSCPAVTLPKPIYGAGWSHFAFHINPNTGKLGFYQDGFLFAELALPNGMEIEPGTLKVGSPDGGTTLGIGGWIDEFKVVEGPFSQEEFCNHARGTLVSVPHTYSGLAGNPLADLLIPFENASSNANAISGRDAVHGELYGTGAQVSSFSDYYVCNIDYSDPLGVSLANPGDPNGQARSIRRRLLFPEGDILWNEHRPNSLGNEFCLACHRPEEEGGLTLDALSVDPDPTILAHLDERRQPMQPPREIFSFIPAHYLGDGKPPANSEDEQIDQWVDDDAVYHWPMDEAAGSTVDNTVTGDVQAIPANGTLHGAQFVPGEARGYALEFDAGRDAVGDVDYVSIDNNIDIPGDGLTLSAWFRIGVDGISTAPEDGCQNFQSATPCTILAKSSDGNHVLDWGMRVFYRSSDGPAAEWKVQFHVKTGTTYNAQTETLMGFDSTAWHHLVGTFDQGAMELFLDGQSIGTFTAASSSLVTDPNHKVTIGSRLSTGGAPIHPFFGLIDDVRIWNRRLQDSEIMDLFTDGP